MYTNCIICNHSCYENNPLTNGKEFHKKCYEELLTKEREHYNKIADFSKKIIAIEINEKRLFTRIKTYFGDDSSIKTKKEKTELKQKVEIIKNDLLNISNKLKFLYDYWPDRPPDWVERRIEFLKQKPFCEECFSDYSKILQIHHIIPISKGGSHKQDNLKVLCKSCHQSKHPFNDFNYESNQHINHFKEKVKLLNDAIKSGHKVSFHYKNWEDEKSSRVINPKGFKLVGKTLCVYGYCHLRQDSRTFAVKRINKLKVT